MLRCSVNHFKGFLVKHSLFYFRPWKRLPNNNFFFLSQDMLTPRRVSMHRWLSRRGSDRESGPGVRIRLCGLYCWRRKRSRPIVERLTPQNATTLDRSACMACGVAVPPGDLVNSALDATTRDCKCPSADQILGGLLLTCCCSLAFFCHVYFPVEKDEAGNFMAGKLCSTCPSPGYVLSSVGCYPCAITFP